MGLPCLSWYKIAHNGTTRPPDHPTTRAAPKPRHTAKRAYLDRVTDGRNANWQQPGFERLGYVRQTVMPTVNRSLRSLHLRPPLIPLQPMRS